MVEKTCRNCKNARGHEGRDYCKLNGNTILLGGTCSDWEQFQEAEG